MKLEAATGSVIGKLELENFRKFNTSLNSKNSLLTDIHITEVKLCWALFKYAQ